MQKQNSLHIKTKRQKFFPEFLSSHFHFSCPLKTKHIIYRGLDLLISGQETKESKFIRLTQKYSLLFPANVYCVGRVIATATATATIRICFSVAGYPSLDSLPPRVLLPGHFLHSLLQVLHNNPVAKPACKPGRSSGGSRGQRRFPGDRPLHHRIFPHVHLLHRQGLPEGTVWARMRHLLGGVRGRQRFAPLDLLQSRLPPRMH